MCFCFARDSQYCYYIVRLYIVRLNPYIADHECCKTRLNLDWLQFLKQIFIYVSYYILVASLTLVALFRAIRVRLATSSI